MAAVTVVDSGARLLLAGALAPRRWVRLYRNDVDVVAGSFLGDFEVSLFPGYADQEITALWSTPIVDPLGRAVATLLGLTWTRGAGPGSETVYGWVMYEAPAPDSVLVAGKRLNVPVPMSAAGNAVLVSIAAYLLRG